MAGNKKDTQQGTNTDLNKDLNKDQQRQQSGRDFDMDRGGGSKEKSSDVSGNVYNRDAEKESGRSNIGTDARDRNKDDIR